RDASLLHDGRRIGGEAGVFGEAEAGFSKISVAAVIGAGARGRAIRENRGGRLAMGRLWQSSLRDLCLVGIVCPALKRPGYFQGSLRERSDFGLRSRTKMEKSGRFGSSGGRG